MFLVAKARDVQLNACSSSFAAAHWAVCESLELPLLKAPLLRWGSSCAVWKCRAARCAAPTVYAEAPRPFVGAGHWPTRHIEDGKAARPGGRALQGRTPVVAGGHMGAAPTAEIIPGTLVRQSQAHSLNRTSSNFCKPRAQWPGGNLERHSDFARRKCRTTYQEGVLRNGGRGKRPMDLGGTEWSRSQSDASPGAFWFLCRHGQRNSPPAGGEISHEKRWRRSPPI